MPDDVAIGREGWLFLTGGTNEALRYFDEPDFFAEAQREGWRALLSNRHERAKALGIRYCHLAAPEKLGVYPEFFPRELPYFECAPSLAIAKLAAEDDGALHDCFVDVHPFLSARKRLGDLLYFKTDTHWTFEGAFAAYEALCERLDATPNQSLLSIPQSSGMLFLDLGSKLSPPVEELFSSRNALVRGRRTFANALVLYKEQNALEGEGGLHIGSNVEFENEHAADPRTVVLFGDSFAEYRTHLLTGMLAETFARTHFIWSAQVDWGYVERVRPDVLVTEFAERFMNYVPEDDFDVTAFAEERVGAHRASLEGGEVAHD